MSRAGLILDPARALLNSGRTPQYGTLFEATEALDITSDGLTQWLPVSRLDWNNLNA